MVSHNFQFLLNISRRGPDLSVNYLARAVVNVNQTSEHCKTFTQSNRIDKREDELATRKHHEQTHSTNTCVVNNSSAAFSIELEHVSELRAKGSTVRNTQLVVSI